MLQDVGVAFGAAQVLHRLTVELAEGQATAIMGPSGSGKTTLLSVIAGLRTPDEGSRHVSEADATPACARDLSIAWVFQTSPVFMRRTALENVALGPRCVGVDARSSRARAHEALASLGIDHLAGQQLHRLSGGERQRVVIARALCSRAELVIADEPTAALDGEAKQLVCDALISLADAGAVLVVATHDPTVAGACDRVLRLERGRLVSS
ncbi:MAG: transporter ATP-binding protein [Ilumatobacteraceae bacterium]|nr:transporter ATP-binding protein [Ilumatobacteraceae bacterium]